MLGNTINEKSLASLRSMVSLVSQDVHIYPKTVAENIGLGNKKAAIDEIVAASKAANAHEFIMNLPTGYETVLSEGGVNLSGGQRQRITLARAILKNAPILLLDEPTSALDSQSEELINATLSNIAKDRIVLIVAHRLSTIKQADEVLVLDKGRLVEKGKHEDLLKSCGVYSRLYHSQLSKQKSKIEGEVAV